MLAAGLRILHHCGRGRRWRGAAQYSPEGRLPGTEERYSTSPVYISTVHGHIVSLSYGVLLSAHPILAYYDNGFKKEANLVSAVLTRKKDHDNKVDSPEKWIRHGTPAIQRYTYVGQREIICYRVIPSRVRRGRAFSCFHSLRENFDFDRTVMSLSIHHG